MKPQKFDRLGEAFGKLFFSVHAVTDREEDYYYSRINVGLTFESIKKILSESCGINLENDEISCELDLCVDYGLAVPKVLRQNSVWLRACYSGENFNTIQEQQFKNFIHKNYKDFLSQRNTTPFGKYEMHKLLCSLKELHEWLPISATYNLYGRFVKVEKQIGKYTDLMDCIVGDYRSLPLNKKRNDSGKWIIEPKPDYSSLVADVWDSQKMKDLCDDFEHLAKVFSKLKYDNAILLLSTCRNHECTLNAVAFEAHSWIKHETKSGFEDLLNDCIEGLYEPTYKNSILRLLYWRTVMITEAKKKYQLFHHDFSTFVKKLEKTFQKVGSSGERLWEYRISPLLDSSIDESAQRLFNYIKPLVELMEVLTSFLSNLMIEAGVFSESELRLTFREHEITADMMGNFEWLFQGSVQMRAHEYNRLVNSKSFAKSILKSELDGSLYDAAPENRKQAVEDIINECNRCYHEIKTALEFYVPPIEDQKGIITYYSKKKSVTPYGSEIILKDVFLSHLDIIKGTNQQQTNAMKDKILQICKDFEHKIYYEITGNDEFLICTKDQDATVLFDIAEIIMNAGNAMINDWSEFRGTRKSIMKVSILGKILEEKFTFRDYKIPNEIPQGCYLSEMYKSNDELKALYERHNSLLVIEDKTFGELKTEFSLVTLNKNALEGESKHFTGKYHYLDLTQK